jgi:hypothetical protein
MDRPGGGSNPHERRDDEMKRERELDAKFEAKTITRKELLELREIKRANIAHLTIKGGVK